MIEEKATVVAVYAHSITVASTVKSSCSSCQQIDSCGSGQIAKAIPQKTLITDINCSELACAEQTLMVGDEVILGIPEKDMLLTAWQVYLWPIIGLLIFSAVGQWLLITHYLHHEPLAITLGLLGGYIGFQLAKFRQKQRENSDWLAPKLLSVLPKTIVVTQLSTNKADNEQNL
jgi:sigma-E factor negative regulatory protein RseC